MGTKIGIVGVGPRGLSILERIVANERGSKSIDMEVFLFDPNEPGVGCHDPEQSEHLLVNTVAGQITLFSDATVRGAGPIMEGPSFYQWLQSQPVAKPGLAEISPDSYYSRSQFGRYLHWVYQHLCELAPAHVKIYFVNAAVQRADRNAEGDWLLQAADTQFRVNFLYLTTGHTKPKAMAMSPVVANETTVVYDPYPVKQRLSFIEPGMTVAVEGMGLTTCDVLADLTVGRGGRFITAADGSKRYVASGYEPRIISYSRSGLPLSSRAVNQKGVAIQYRPHFLLAEPLRKLRATRKLDFVEDVLPLLIADMEYAYCDAYLREHRGTVTALLFCNQFVCADAGQRQALIAQYIPASDRFSWDRMVNPVPEDALSSRADFKDWLVSYLQEDLREAKKGNLDSPMKAASDVLRDVRDNLRAAIDYGGLTEASHRWLYSEFLSVMNRVAVGPPSSRIAEMLALMEAGVLEADWGPGAACTRPADGGLMCMSTAMWAQLPREVDVLIKARVSLHSPQDDASPLLQGLLKAGHVRLFYNGEFHPGGIEIDRDFNWMSRHGEAIDNAWALGIPTEGIKFYTFVVPRSGVNSTAIVDAGRAVGKMLSMITSPATMTS